MKINRRSLLKLLAWTPFAAPLIVKALSEPKPVVAVAEDFRLDQFWTEPQVKPTLTVLIGKPKTGKTLLAKRLFNAKTTISVDFEGEHGDWSARSRPHQTMIIDHCETLTNPAADCASLLKVGASVVAIYQETKDIKNVMLAHLYGGSPTIFMRADRIIRIQSVRWLTDSAGKPAAQWECVTLKNRWEPNIEHSSAPWGFYCNA